MTLLLYWLVVSASLAASLGSASAEGEKVENGGTPSITPTRMDLSNLAVDFNYTANVRECIDSLQSLTNSLVGIAAASSSDTSMLAASSDPFGFAADIGNYDMCMRQRGKLAHCLAGSLKLGDPFVALPPHSGICVPSTCGPKELQDPQLLKRLRREIAAMVVRDPAASPLLMQHGQQRFIYYVKLENTIQLTAASNTSYSCGAHRASMTFDRYLFFFMFAVLLLIVAASTVYQMMTTTVRGGGEGDKEEEEKGQGEGVNDRGKWSLWRGAVVNAFSLVNTVPFIFQPRPTALPGREEPDQFIALDGLRAISILWIILGHTLTVSTSIGLLNPAAVLPPSGFLKNVSAQLLLSSRFAVDTFFFISGFLVVLSLLKRLSAPADTASDYVSSAAAAAAAATAASASPAVAAAASAAVSGASTNLQEEHLPRPKSQILLSYGNKDFELSPVPITALLTGRETQPLGARKAGYQGVTLSNEEDGVEADEEGPWVSRVPPLRSWLPSFYVHRLLRIWPPYVFCLLVWWKIGVLLGSGPFWYRWLSFTHRCDMYFWTNLLFVNNLHPYDISESDECFYISWYLADDMQFYLISPIFVRAYLHNDALGVALVLVALLLSGYAGYAQSLRHGWSAHSFDGLNVTQYSHHFYTKPQYRLPSYAVGMLSAMLWHIKCSKFPNWRLPDFVARAVLLTSCAILTLLTFGGASAYQQRPCGYYEAISPACGSNWHPGTLALYNALSKPLWCVAIGAITLLSGNRQGGAVEKFLSHPVWAPPAKLSFAVYLLHVILINIWMLGRTQKLRYSHFDFAMDYCGIVFVSFAAALVVAVVVESPSARLSKTLETLLTRWYYS